MNKTFLAIAVVGLLTLFTSAYYSAPADSRIGYKTPALILDNNNGLSPLQQHRGENILLTFWSSADAVSRLENMRYDRLSRQDGVTYTHVSVNMDRNQSVFNSIVTIDNLDRSAQFSTSTEVQDDIIRSWRLENGYHSFLIDAQGKIVAIDPDEQTLAKIK
ncbi:MAG: hypothetical protein IKW85_05640 [Muribaculaceae bacterium]|nr:hypothetical protein [Muribaculaceae bacterium]